MGSDHNLVVIEFKFCVNYSHNTLNKDLDIKQLNYSEIQSKVEQELAEEPF